VTGPLTRPTTNPASGRPPGRILVLACGEASRGDDAAGLLAAAEIRRWIAGTAEPPGPVRGLLQALRDRVDVITIGQLEPDDLLDVAGDDAVVVVDAVRGVEPGSIVRRPLVDLAAGGPTPRSSHMLPLQDVLGLAQTLRGSLPRGVFVGLGGSVFELGAAPSRPVLQGLVAFAAAVVEEADRLSRE